MKKGLHFSDHINRTAQETDGYPIFYKTLWQFMHFIESFEPRWLYQYTVVPILSFFWKDFRPTGLLSSM